MTPNEYRMLSCCGLKQTIDQAGNLIPIATYYKMAVEWCFLNKKEGPVAEALRFAYLNIWVNGTLFRDTASFDELIGERLNPQPEPDEMIECAWCGEYERKSYMEPASKPDLIWKPKAGTYPEEGMICYDCHTPK